MPILLGLASARIGQPPQLADVPVEEPTPGVFRRHRR
jgi:hypothetical protein